MKTYALRSIFIFSFCLSCFSCDDRSLPDLVNVEEVIPEVVIDARYAGGNNFVGLPIDGYFMPRVLLTSDAANALRHVQLEIEKFGLGLKFFLNISEITTISSPSNTTSSIHSLSLLPKAAPLLTAFSSG